MTADELADVIHGTVTRALAPVRATVTALEALLVRAGELGERIAALEARALPLETFAGVCERLAVLETRAPVPGPAGAPGADGVGFDDVAVALEADGRTVMVTFTKGDRVRAFPLAFPAMCYRGVWAAARHVPGDVVTWEGSAWVCREATDTKPGTGSAWTLAVKRGRS